MLTLTLLTQGAVVDGSYVYFDGMHKSCSRCKQVSR